MRDIHPPQRQPGLRSRSGCFGGVGRRCCGGRVGKAFRRPHRFAHRLFARATGTAASQGFRTAHSFETGRMAPDVPHSPRRSLRRSQGRHATRSWPKTLGNRLYGSLSRTFGMSRNPDQRAGNARAEPAVGPDRPISWARRRLRVIILSIRHTAIIGACVGRGNLEPNLDWSGDRCRRRRPTTNRELDNKTSSVFVIRLRHGEILWARAGFVLNPIHERSHPARIVGREPLPSVPAPYTWPL